MTDATITLDVHGDVEPVTTDDEPSVIKPPEVTLTAPSEGDHVAIVRANAPVSFLAIYDRDDLESFTSDVYLPTGDGPREFWLDVEHISGATQLHVNTDEGRELSSLDLRVEYRGWRGRVAKLLRGWKRRLRTERRFWQRGGSE